MRRLVAGVIVLVAAMLPVATTQPASAGVGVDASFSNGTLTVNGGGGGDFLSFGCDGSNHVVGSGMDFTLNCDDVVTVIVNGDDGDDELHIGGFDADFSSLTSLTGNGGDGDDEFEPNDVTSETVNGGAGADEFIGSLGNDIVRGGPGPDFLRFYGLAGPLTVTDTAITGQVSQTLAGIERIQVEGTDDPNTYDLTGFSKEGQVYGYGGADTLTGGPSFNYLAGGGAGDMLTGGGGDDEFEGDDSTNSDDTILGGAGHDQLFHHLNGSGTLSNTTATGMGTDTISSIEFVYARAETASMDLNASAFSGDVYFEATDNSDTMIGGSGDDFFIIEGGSDVATGNGGTDEITVDAEGTSVIGASAVTSDVGNATFSGIERARLSGSGAVDTFDASGFSGALKISPDGGSDTIVGNGTNTRVSLDADGSSTATNTAFMHGADTVTMADVTFLELGGGNGNDTADAKAVTLRTVMEGGDGADTLLGGTKADQLFGSDGNDVLKGFDGKDKLYGEAGADSLNGGNGTDGCQPSKADHLKSCEKSIKLPLND